MSGLLAHLSVVPGTSAPAATTYVTGQSLTTLRNDYGDEVGFEFRLDTDLYFTHLGRWIVAGNSGSHVLRICDASDGTVATATLNTSGATAGAFAFVALASPVFLAANAFARYYCMSMESGGGDQWYEGNSTITTTAVALCTGAAYRSGGFPHQAGASGNSFVPTNFQYTL